ncbi:MAG: hypothetical protein ACTSPD_08095 [Promethearchaeota archaeon]
MYYECPKCLSKKKPKICSYFPPIIVECCDCFERGYEKEFIKEDKYNFTPIPQFH